jgi:hypothetical protein
VSTLLLLSPADAQHSPGVSLTRRPLALSLLGFGAGRILARYRIRVLDLLCLRHGSCFLASPRSWWCGRSANVARRWKLRNAADERLSLAKPHPDLVTCRATQPWILHVPAHGVRAPDFTMQGLSLDVTCATCGDQDSRQSQTSREAASAMRVPC